MIYIEGKNTPGNVLLILRPYLKSKVKVLNAFTLLTQELLQFLSLGMQEVFNQALLLSFVYCPLP